ncbi:hypothetical protein [Nocardia sp. NPDC049149]|uniref:hypothetical protein n=1 Tax=Nocardia sp. NPDC049149 TaxID=3364315 RepID=UPI003715E7A3
MFQRFDGLQDQHDYSARLHVSEYYRKMSIQTLGSLPVAGQTWLHDQPRTSEQHRSPLNADAEASTASDVLVIPDSPLARDVLDFVMSTESVAVANHSVRIWLFARLLARHRGYRSGSFHD